jgi:hypothetical protein
MRHGGWTRVTTLSALWLLAAACAPIYVRSGRLPTVTSLRLDPAGRPTATVRLSSPEFLTPIERATRESGLFSAFTVEPNTAGTSSRDCTVSVSVDARLRQPTGKQVAYTLAAGMTLGVLPLTRQVDLVLTATIADRSGHALKTYRFEDSIREIEQVVIMFVPLGAILTPDRAATRVVENMMRHVYRQLDADRLLAPAPPAARPADRG